MRISDFDHMQDARFNFKPTVQPRNTWTEWPLSSDIQVWLLDPLLVLFYRTKIVFSLQWSFQLGPKPQSDSSELQSLSFNLKGVAVLLGGELVCSSAGLLLEVGFRGQQACKHAC